MGDFVTFSITGATPEKLARSGEYLVQEIISRMYKRDPVPRQAGVSGFGVQVFGHLNNESDHIFLQDYDKLRNITSYELRADHKSFMREQLAAIKSGQKPQPNLATRLQDALVIGMVHVDRLSDIENHAETFTEGLADAAMEKLRNPNQDTYCMGQTNVAIPLQLQAKALYICGASELTWFDAASLQVEPIKRQFPQVYRRHCATLERLIL